VRFVLFRAFFLRRTSTSLQIWACPRILDKSTLQNSYFQYICSWTGFGYISILTGSTLVAILRSFQRTITLNNISRLTQTPISPYVVKYPLKELFTHAIYSDRLGSPIMDNRYRRINLLITVRFRAGRFTTAHSIIPHRAISFLLISSYHLSFVHTPPGLISILTQNLVYWFWVTSSEPF
jgi:hypothetical protein